MWNQDDARWGRGLKFELVCGVCNVAVGPICGLVILHLAIEKALLVDIDTESPSLVTREAVSLKDLESALTAKGFGKFSGGKVDRWDHRSLEFPLYLKVPTIAGGDVARSVVVHPALLKLRPELFEIPGVKVEGDFYHNSNLRDFPKRLHTGRRPTNYGSDCSFATREAFIEFLDNLLLRPLAEDVQDPHHGHACWWVNHKQTFMQEVEGNYIWSPIHKSNGKENIFYDNMLRVMPGDVIFSFANAAIQAIGICEASAALAPKPAEFGTAGRDWHNEGWLIPTKFYRLKIPIRPKEHMDVLGPTLPEKYSPIRESGDGNQGAYLAELPDQMTATVIRLLGEQWTRFVDLSSPVAEAIRSDDEGVEERAAAEIQNRTDIGATERQQLVRSRRGQGVYRRNLEGFETACRVTGVAILSHLRASHIKPWRVSSDFEKLDGNNGLLLSPHIDHLFDRGFISFTDEGVLLVANDMDEATLQKWGLEPGAHCGSFRPEQLPYLEFHRAYIFNNAKRLRN